MTLFLLLLASLTAAATLAFMPSESSLRKLSIAWSTVVFGLVCAVTFPILVQSSVFEWKFLRVDSFAALLISLVGFVQWTATLVSAPYLREEFHEGIVTLKQMRLYHVLLQLFVLSMMLVLSADNIGLMWVALEATTLATTLLVAFYSKKESLEAAWKYIVLCSVGISLGLLGVLLVFYAASAVGLQADLSHLSWRDLRTVATGFHPSVMRWAFVFIFIGYGAKVGFVPLHTWLPDAHGRTPSPISGMLSGVLLNIALFAILRFKSLTDGALGSSEWTNGFFLVFGAISFILPAAFIVVQKNYKRLLAYSSIEHMGFTAFCIGLGAPGAVAALVHMIGHSFAKSMLFFGTGNILLRWKSTKIDHIGSVMKTLPYTGMFFLFGILALLATPPSPLFWSEYSGFSAGIASHPWLVIGMLLAGVVIFAGMIRNMMPMMYGKHSDQSEGPVERWNLSHTAMALHLLVIVAVGILFLNPAVHARLAAIASSMY